MLRSQAGATRPLAVRYTAVFATAVFAVAMFGARAADAATKTTVKVATVPGVGAVLVNPQGRTLYTLTDADGAAVDCTGACASAWPPYTVAADAKVTAPKGVKSLSTTSDTHQVTWKDLPLYTFAGDTRAKVANGNGVDSFGGTWSVVKAKRSARAATTPTTPTTKGSSGYSGY